MYTGRYYHKWDILVDGDLIKFIRVNAIDFSTDALRACTNQEGAYLSFDGNKWQLDNHNPTGMSGRAYSSGSIQVYLQNHQPERKLKVVKENVKMTDGIENVYTDQELKDIKSFTWNPSLTDAQKMRMSTLREAGEKLCCLIINNVNNCADRSAAIRDLRKAIMQANLAIAHE